MVPISFASVRSSFTDIPSPDPVRLQAAFPGAHVNEYCASHDDGRRCQEVVVTCTVSLQSAANVPWHAGTGLTGKHNSALLTVIHCFNVIRVYSMNSVL